MFGWLFPKNVKPPPYEEKSLLNAINGRFFNDWHHFPPFEVYWQMILICRRFDLDYPYHPLLEEMLFKTFVAIFSNVPQSFRLTKKEFLERGKLWDEDLDSFNRGTPTVPLYDLVNVSKCILQIFANFCYDDTLKFSDLATPIRQQLIKNELSAAGVSAYEARKKRYTLAHEHDLEPEEHLKTTLRDTPFLEFFNTLVPFCIPRDLFSSHTFICAPPRHGKTQCIQSFCAQFLTDPDPPGLFVLDPHGDLFKTLRERVDPSRLVVLDPVTDPPPLNFLDFGSSNDIHALQSFTYLMSSLSGGLSEKQAGITPYLFSLLRKMPTPTLDTLRSIIEDDAKTPEKSPLYPYIQKLEPRAQDFFRNQFFGGMKETKQAIAWKIYAAMGSDAFAKMFASTHNTFNAAECMRQRKVVLARGSETVLGEHGLPIFLQFIVSQCLMAALRRIDLPEKERHLCLIVVDEAKHVFNNQTERILTECRKANVGYLAATQLLSQIPDDVRSAIYGATAIKIAGPVQSSDANQLSREMFCSPDFIRSMEPVRGSHADWAFYVQEVTRGRAMKVRCPYGVLESMPKVERSSETKYSSQIRPVSEPEPSPQQPQPPPSPSPERKVESSSFEIKPGKKTW